MWVEDSNFCQNPGMRTRSLLRTAGTLLVFFAFLRLTTSERLLRDLQSVFALRIADTLKIGVQPRPQLPGLEDFARGFPDSLLPFSRGPKSKREIALSFDACPTGSRNRFSRTIFNTLVTTQTPATVFLSGYWVKEDSEATRLLASDSLIELANHSYSHPHLTHLNESKIRQELQRTQDVIFSLTGRKPYLFRPPYGEYDDTLINIAKQLGLVTVQFDVASGDPDTTFTAQRLVNWVTKEARNGSVVIMHINNRGWHTAEALPAIIDSLRTKGYRLVTVGDLLKGTAEQIGLESLNTMADGNQVHVRH